ncbi:MAG: RagB/SusD family nutrient uptake outer membrane protein [Bacteroidetes bacterium]|nr:RagB/SusD family nutrient uptake outer membrane protein [Bacteroidota bacterium]MBU1374026.1 RagB/SusD family nutrient uptake outer membrane protein [Bacteroidota bacterium]MBU1484634.1 RagB/SusD family nutrient uptake outer membrane protein [Bacteroidota bacterium]MBU1760606.1 RagB/SusD family nutrient uptake outer membrane protein [Bacteroidota bacterium]MBU2045956.1 RagB/SusD family nutrient uptake outer membrane protein [Bacteroidota bacterium]
MKNINKKILITFSGILLVSISGCTKLDEEVLGSKFVNTSTTSSTADLAGVYNVLNGFTDQANLYALQEQSTDEMMGPTRGTDWGDFGTWRKLHQHTWDPFHNQINSTWDQLNTGVYRATQVIAAASDNKIKAEASFLRAFFMFQMVDLFGQQPFRNPTDSPETNPKVMSRVEATDFLIKDLEFAEANLPLGSADKANKTAAQTLLAKVYLNKAVYTGTTLGGPYTFAKADMDKAVDYCNKVISTSGKSLTPTYFDNFAPENTALSKEEIFVIGNKEGAAIGNVQNRFRMTLHYNQTPSGWNGFTTLADFYHSFESTDQRIGGSYPGFTDKVGMKSGFLIGQQYGPNNEVLKDRSGNNLVFTENVNLLFAKEADGIRVIKYIPKPNAKNDGIIEQAANDYIFLRFADVLLMKAEGILRGGTDAQGKTALQLVNDLRSTRGASLFTSLDVKNLLAERGRELYWEGWRRNDMIRFGVFNDPVDQRATKSAPSRTLFPIPQRAVDTNPNLKQNPGY